MQFRTRKNKKDGRVPKIFITFEMNLHVKLIPFTMKQLCTLLCLLLLGGACSDDDTNDGGYEGIPEITVDGGGVGHYCRVARRR